MVFSNIYGFPLKANLTLMYWHVCMYRKAENCQLLWFSFEWCIFFLYQFEGEDIYSPSTDISAISSEHAKQSELADDTNQSRFYSFGPILQAMIDEWRLGEEILSKEKSRK